MTHPIPSSVFGLRLMAIIALATGVYHLGRRKAVGLLSDLLGIELSLGALSQVEARVGDAVLVRRFHEPVLRNAVA